LRIANSICDYDQEQQTGTARDKQSELEWMLCAAAYADTEMAMKECGFINASLFHASQLFKLWDGLMRGKDKVKLATELGLLNDLLEMRGRINLADMSKYADQVARMMYLEDVAMKIGDMQKHLSSLEYDQVQTDISELSGMTPIAGRRPKDAKQSAADFLAVLDNLEDRSIKTYIPDLDAKTGGMERQTLTVLGARPSMGKTTLAIQIGRSNAASGRKVLVFSLEMSSNQLWAKMACGALGIRWRDVRDSKVSNIVIQQIKEKVKELADVYAERLLFEDGQSDSPSIWYQVARERPDLIIIDHLRLVADHEESEVRRLGNITNQIKLIAKKFNCAALLLCQLNRQTEARGGEEKRPQLADLRESGHIEENADNVWMIYRGSYYGEETDETEILIRKFRDDVLSQKAIATFNAKAQWFE
jgi:replicative DNA helicase